MKKQLVSWRRIGIDHVYVEYKDNDYQPEPNPLDENRSHGHRYFNEVIRIYQFETRHGLIHRGDENGHNYQQLKDVDTLTCIRRLSSAR